MSTKKIGIHFDSMIVNSEVIPISKKVSIKKGYNKINKSYFVRGGVTESVILVDPTASNQSEVKVTLPCTSEIIRFISMLNNNYGELEVSLVNNKHPHMNLTFNDMHLDNDPEINTDNDGIEITLKGKALN